MNHKRNEMILKESRKNWRDEPKKEVATTQKAMDPQLVEKLYNISKLSNRISERLKNMTATMDKHRG